MFYPKNLMPLLECYLIKAETQAEHVPNASTPTKMDIGL